MVSTAVPSAGSASTISPLATAISSLLPNSPTCAVPTLRTVATWGGAIVHRYATWPTPRAPISATRNRVRRSIRQTVNGTPSSLLRLPTGATVGPGRLEHLGQQVLGRGLARRAGDRHHPESAGDRPVDLVAGQPPGREQRVLDHQARTRRRPAPVAR